MSTNSVNQICLGWGQEHSVPCMLCSTLCELPEKSAWHEQATSEILVREWGSLCISSSLPAQHSQEVGQERSGWGRRILLWLFSWKKNNLNRIIAFSSCFFYSTPTVTVGAMQEKRRWVATAWTLLLLCLGSWEVNWSSCLSSWVGSGTREVAGRCLVWSKSHISPSHDWAGLLLL